MNAQVDKLWRATDEKGTRLGTYLPNCFLESMISGTYTIREIRILLYICRMSFGFQREETNYLGLSDFSRATDMAVSHVSKVIKVLVTEQVIFKGKKSGNKFKYAINLLSYGMSMLHYRICSKEDSFGNEDYIISKLLYQNGNIEVNNNLVIVYNPRGYKKYEESYIKEDIKKDIKVDIAENVYFQEYTEVDLKKHEELVKVTEQQVVKLLREGDCHDFQTFTKAFQIARKGGVSNGWVWDEWMNRILPEKQMIDPNFKWDRKVINNGLGQLNKIAKEEKFKNQKGE